MSPVAQASGQSPAQGQGQSKRRSFDGIHRPNMTPMSIIPYPSPESNAPTGGNQQVQTPRMASGQGAFRFPRPSTPVTSPRGVKKGLVGFEESRYNDGNEDGIVFMGTGAGAESRVDTGEGETGTGTGVMGQQTSGFQIAAPIPGYAHAFSKGMGIQGHNKSDADGMYASPLRPLEAVPEEVSPGGAGKKHGTRKDPEGVEAWHRPEEMEGDGKSIEGDTQSQGSAKRMRRELVDNEEYIPLSSPQIPPTPVVHAAPLRDLADPSLTLDSLFGAIEQFVTIAEFEAECKLWTECTTEEWLKGADELIGEYTEMLNMLKDHLTEKVMAFSNLMNTVGERRAELNRDSKTYARWNGNCERKSPATGDEEVMKSRQAQRPDSMGLTQALGTAYGMKSKREETVFGAGHSHHHPVAVDKIYCITQEYSFVTLKLAMNSLFCSMWGHQYPSSSSGSTVKLPQFITYVHIRVELNYTPPSCFRSISSACVETGVEYRSVTVDVRNNSNMVSYSETSGPLFPLARRADAPRPEQAQ
ncbi:hypothetical protein BU15DRAFT_65788 [Melanogaster broomeanus]|nr:hypothetical protein BU15DRAFT_65788 [Melanogaster broomeanus]